MKLKKTITFNTFDNNEISQIKENAVEIYKHLKIATPEQTLGEIQDERGEDVVLDILEQHLPFVKENRNVIIELGGDDFTEFVEQLQQIVNKTITDIKLDHGKIEITVNDVKKYKTDDEDTFISYIDSYVDSDDLYNFLKEHNLVDEYLAKYIF